MPLFADPSECFPRCQGNGCCSDCGDDRRSCESCGHPIELGAEHIWAENECPYHGDCLELAQQDTAFEEAKLLGMA